jgi:HAD superfamily hydrolase (TIGR01458 family)
MKISLPLLIDFDGVIKLANKPAPGASYFLKYISGNKIPSVILSNSTLYSGKQIRNFLAQHNMDFGIPCITTVDASLSYIKDNYMKIKPYCADNIKPLFSSFISEDSPDAVLIGDLQEKWSYDILNEIFRYVYNGAAIIAMQKNKFWKPAGELCLDAGAFIAAIEYASGKESVLIGKPSPVYFESALKMCGFKPGDEFTMIGDDIENDIRAAQKLGGKGLLIYTGKTPFPLPNNYRIKPDAEVFNLKEVIFFL